MGEIVFWSLMRLTASLVFLAFTWQYYPIEWRFIIAMAFLSVFVFLPGRKGYISFREKNNNALAGTLCAMCKHFDATAVICLKHDEHPTREYLPCDGIDWEAGKPYSSSGDIFTNHEKRKLNSEE